MKVELTRVAIPADLSGAGAADFVESCDVANASEIETWGGDDFVYAPESTLTMFGGSAHHSRFVWLARLDGLPVGRVVITFPLEEDATHAELSVDVVPVARGRGIGAALLAHGEEFIATGGRLDVAGFTQHRVTDSEASVTAFELPDDHDSRFVRARGYRLAQLQVMDELMLPLPAARHETLRAEASARPGPEYRLVQWWRHAPGELLAAFARIREQLVREVPHDGLVLEPERWDAAHVRAVEDRRIERGEPALVTAVEHTPSGELVGYTEILVAQGSPRVEQHDTLVVPAHRGHRLGLLMKLANLEQLAASAPEVTSVLTWTAVDNAPMRRINTALGFRPRGLLGNWRKHLD